MISAALVSLNILVLLPSELVSSDSCVPPDQAYSQLLQASIPQPSHLAKKRNFIIKSHWSGFIHMFLPEPIPVTKEMECADWTEVVTYPLPNLPPPWSQEARSASCEPRGWCREGWLPEGKSKCNYSSGIVAGQAKTTGICGPHQFFFQCLHAFRCSVSATRKYCVLFLLIL